MHQTPVVRLADDLARNLAHLPADEAAQAIAAHLRSFWAPSMRTQLAEIVATDPATVPAIVAAALDRLGAGK